MEVFSFMLFNFLASSTKAAVAADPKAMLVEYALPEVVGTLGHHRVALIGENLHPSDTEVWASAPSMPEAVLLKTHFHSSDPHGTQLAVELPALPEGALLELRSKNGEERLLLDGEIFAVRHHATPRGTVHTADQLTAVAGDCVHILMDEAFKLHEVHGRLHDESGEIHPTHLYADSHRHEPEAHGSTSTNREVHLNVPNGVEAGHYDLNIFHHGAGRVDLEHGDASVLVLPSVTNVEADHATGKLAIHGSGFSLHNTEVAVHGVPCEIETADFHALVAKCPEIKDGASALREQEDRGFLLHVISESQKDQAIVLHDSLVWPVAHPQHRTGFRFDTFTATGEGVFRAPRSGTYIFELDCMKMKCAIQVGGYELAHEGTVSVAMEEGDQLDVEVAFTHTQHAQELRLGVTLPDGTVLDAIPADWFTHTELIDTPVSVRVNGHEALCRDTRRTERCHPLAKDASVAMPHVEEMPVIDIHALMAKGVITPARRRLSMPSGAQRWSQWGRQNCGSSSRDCEIPKGTTVFLDQSAEVRVLTIRGTLIWDTDTDNIVLKAASVIVASNGRFELDQTQASSRTRATIYIKNDRGAPDHERIGRRVFGLVHDDKSAQAPVLKIHGRSLGRTWALLTAPANPGDSTITLDKSASETGWRVGDRVAIANTGMTHIKYEIAPEVFTIRSLSGNQVTLNTGVRQLHLGSVEKKMQAEVINLSRDVTITGDDFVSNRGLHTIGAYGGTMQIEYTRVEKCGQRGLMARYCMHFHLMGDQCKDCRLVGNAIERSHQRGIVVHGTHRTMVKENVMYEVRGANLYVEDGNEMENEFRENVMLCHDSASKRVNCKAPGSDNHFADDEHQSGMWTLSPSNNFYFNRAINHEDGFFLQTSAFGNGKGQAAGRVCPIHSPFGDIKGNVFHSCTRFGFYPDNNNPRNLDRDIASNGMLRDRNSCKLFTFDGKDNGLVTKVEDGVDWGHAFVGQYHLGDVQYVRHYSVNNVHQMYWKTTKNFADGETKAHVIDSTFGSDTGMLPGMHGLGFVGAAGLFFGPGGHGVFAMENVKVFGWSAAGAIAANQHCLEGGFAGSLCTPQYELINVDLSEVSSRTEWVQFGASGGEDTLPIFNSHDGSLGRWKSVVAKAQDHLLRLPGNVCRRARDEGEEERFGDNIVCTEPTRRLNIWSVRQTVNLQTPGGGRHTMKWMKPEGHLTKRQGFGAVVVMPPAGTPLSQWQYKFNLNWNASDGNDGPPVTIEFSDLIYKKIYGSDDEIQLVVNGRTCTARSNDDRTWINVDGAFHEGYGSCVSLSGKTPFQAGPKPSPDVPHAAPAPAPPAPSFPPSPCTSSFSDVKKNCGGCKVLADKMNSKHKTCNAYCAANGRRCVGAWEESNNSCAVLENKTCSSDFSFTSDAICECSDSGSSPSPPAPAPSPSGNSGSCTSGWSDVKASCGGCKVLADKMNSKHSTCNSYCQAQGRSCVGAWEESNNSCNVLETKTCSSDFGFTSDAICECSASGSSPATPALLAPLGPAPGFSGNSGSCSTSGWSDVKASCGGCKVLADNMNSKHRTCSAYCTAQGRSCVGAWEESANSCNVLETKTCTSDFGFASDAICECGASNGGFQNTAPAPQGCATSGWSDVKVSCGGCKVLANNMSARHRTCNAYCRAQGRSCVGAWEESNNSCNVLETKTCNSDFGFTSDAICECS